MTDSDVYLPSASSTESCDTSYSSSKEETKVASTVQPYEGEPHASNEDFDEHWQRRCLACGFGSRLEQKTPVTEYLVCCVCFSFSMAKSMFRMGSVFVSVAVRFHSFALSAVKVPLAQCSTVSVLWSNSLSKPKANFLKKESTVSRGTTIFRREVIEQFHYKLLLCPKSAKAKAIVVEPVKQKTSESIVIWLQLISTGDFNREKLLHFKCSIAIWPISPNG